MTRRAQLASIYLRIGRTYWRWAPSLMLLAVVVFVPLGLVHALTLEGNISSFDFDNGLKLLALFGAVMALAATGLVGEVFYTGAVSILLTHPHENGQPPSMREIAGMIKYGPLIAIDLLYGLAVGLGWFFFLIPGILIYVWFGLTAPVVEIEHLGIRASLVKGKRQTGEAQAQAQATEQIGADRQGRRYLRSEPEHVRKRALARTGRSPRRRLCDDAFGHLAARSRTFPPARAEGTAVGRTGLRQVRAGPGAGHALRPAGTGSGGSGRRQRLCRGPRTPRCRGRRTLRPRP
jgi:hypothetical protein